MNAITSHHVTASTPHLIQRRNPVTGGWETTAYRHNLAATDETLSQLTRNYAGKGVRFRAIPFAREMVRTG